MGDIPGGPVPVTPGLQPRSPPQQPRMLIAA